MKNNKILYLLTILITLFSFNMKANAAEQMTCLYSDYLSGSEKDHIALLQYVSGEKELYKLKFDEKVDINSKNWVKSEGRALKDKIIIYQSDSKEFEGNLTTCPEKVKYFMEYGEVNYSFYIEDEWDEKNYKEWMYLVKEPKEIYEYIPEFALIQTIIPKKVSDYNDDDLIQQETSNYTGGKYTGICKYRRNTDDGMHYIQINLGTKDVLFTEYDPEKGEKYSGMPYYDGTYDKYSFAINNKFNFSTLYNTENCPSQIYVSRLKYMEPGSGVNFVNTEVYKNFDDTSQYSEAGSYILYKVSGNHPKTGKALSLEESFGTNIQFVTTGTIENCEELFGEDIYGYINIIWNIIKIGIPVILIVLGAVDFAQAIFSGKEEGMKKAQEKFIKRIIVAVIIFIVPSILGLLLEIANSVWDNVGTDICGIIF